MFSSTLDIRKLISFVDVLGTDLGHNEQAVMATAAIATEGAGRKEVN